MKAARYNGRVVTRKHLMGLPKGQLVKNFMELLRVYNNLCEIRDCENCTCFVEENECPKFGFLRAVKGGQDVTGSQH